MVSSAATMASQTHLFSLTQHRLLHPIQHKRKHSPILFHRPPPSSSSSSLFRNNSHSVSVTQHHTNPPTVAAISTQTNTEQASASAAASAQELLEGSTCTVTTLLGMALLFLRAFQKLPSFLSLKSVPVSMSVMGTLFFASLKDRPSGYLNTPLTVAAAGLGKWLDIYSDVLMVRVLLIWFPNIPWERQPLSAIRDLCDSYLNLFRNIIPPIFDTLDVSPLLAFAVLGTLGSILHTAMT